MNRVLLTILLAAAMLAGSCSRDAKTRYLVISEAVHFELQPGSGTLNLPVFAGTMGLEKIVRDVSQAEFYFQKLSAVYGPKSFRFLADSTVELLLEKSGPLHSPQPVYGFDEADARIELSLVSYENQTAHYVFRVSDKKTGQVRNHAVEIPAGQSASIGMLFDPQQNRGHLVCVAVQALPITGDLKPQQLADFLRSKNAPRGVTTATGYRPGDQRWMDDIFGPRGLTLGTGLEASAQGRPDSLAPQKATTPDSAASGGFTTFDVPPGPVGGMAALADHFKYPESAKKDSVEGKVIVKVWIDSSGVVRHCDVVRGVRRDLDSAAVETIRGVRFTPALAQDKPVAATVMIPIVFRLN
jgi:protein TonB